VAIDFPFSPVLFHEEGNIYLSGAKTISVNCLSPWSLNITCGELKPLTLPSPRWGEGRVRGILGEYLLQRLGLFDVFRENDSESG
jgi:hypothetical protein